MCGRFASAEKRLNVVHFFLQTREVHSFALFYFTHTKSVKFTNVNVPNITRQWKSTFYETTLYSDGTRLWRAEKHRSKPWCAYLILLFISNYWFEWTKLVKNLAAFRKFPQVSLKKKKIVSVPFFFVSFTQTHPPPATTKKKISGSLAISLSFSLLWFVRFSSPSFLSLSKYKFMSGGKSCQFSCLKLTMSK